MKLVNLDQTIFIPVVDETHGGVTVEMQMTVGEFFGKFCKGFEPEMVEAIPVEWLEKHAYGNINDNDGNTYGRKYITISEALLMWQKEQEAR